MWIPPRIIWSEPQTAILKLTRDQFSGMLQGSNSFHTSPNIPNPVSRKDENDRREGTMTLQSSERSKKMEHKKCALRINGNQENSRDTT